MSRAILDISISLDGYAAGPDIGPENPLGVGGERLHDWVFSGATDTGRRMQDEVFDGAGAVVMGRSTFDLGRRFWDPDTFFGLPVVVVTRRGEEPIADPGGSTFTFVADGAERALESARAAAGDRDVLVMGGPTTAGQLLAAGLLDEVRLHVAHAVLGGGTALFQPNRRPLELRATRVVGDEGVTHFRFSPAGSR